jgi:WD40 repeat protein
MFGAANYSGSVVGTGNGRPVGPPLRGPVNEIFEISVRPRSDVLAISSADRTIWLWDADPEARWSWRRRRLGTMCLAPHRLPGERE